MKERIIEINADERLIVTVAQEQQLQTEQEPTHESLSYGRLQYRQGGISDIHFNVEDNKNSEYEQDLLNAVAYFENEGVDSINSSGDICESNDEDLDSFRRSYGHTSIPFFTCMGNHDHERIYHKRTKIGDLSEEECERMWQNCVGVFQGKNLHYFGTTYKDHLNYWYEKNGDIWVFISIDYGKSTGTPWDDMCRGWNIMDYNSKAVQLMTEYVSDTKYDRSRELKFDYQFYNPSVLVWLKDLIAKNPKKRIFLFMHHFMPNMAGDTNNVYKHLRIWPVPTSDAIRNKYYSGSNTVCGMTFWFLNKLLMEHRNIICFGGHSHFCWKEQEDIITRNYDVKQPTGNEVTPIVDDLNSLTDTQYDYHLYEPVGHSTADCAPTVHLPSLAKPTSRSGQSLYGGSEGALIEVYEGGVIIRCIRFKADGSKEYTNEEVKTINIDIPNDQSPVVEPEQPESEPEHAANGIKIVFKNQTGQDIRFSGKYQMYKQEDDKEVNLFLCPPNQVDKYCHWSENPFTLKKGEQMTFEFTSQITYKASNGKAIPNEEPMCYGCHFRTADSATWPGGIAAIKFGVCSLDRSTGSSSTGPAMIHAVPLTEDKCLIKEGGTYEVVLDKIKDNATFDKSWIDKPYSKKDKYKYVIL